MGVGSVCVLCHLNACWSVAKLRGLQAKMFILATEMFL